MIKELGPWGLLATMMCGTLSSVLVSLVVGLIYLPFYMHFSDFDSDLMFKTAVVTGLAAGVLLSIVSYIVFICVSFSSTNKFPVFLHKYHVNTIVVFIMLPFYSAVIFSGLQPWVPHQSIPIAAGCGAAGCIFLELIYFVFSCVH